MRSGAWAFFLSFFALLFLFFDKNVQAAPQEDVFNTVSFPSNDLGVLPQWQDVLARIGTKERDALRLCDEAKDCASMPMAIWRAQITSARTLPVTKKLTAINRFVNELEPYSDAEPPSAGERWPGIQETLEGRGGAIGKAILKYISLRDCGFSAENLRIVIGQDVFSGFRTVFVLVRIYGSEYVLDQLSAPARKVGEVNNFLPLYSFNEETVWLHMPHIQETSP